MEKINCGIQLYTLRKYLETESDVIATFNRLSKMGVRTVQISGMKYDMPAKDLKKLCEDTGIKIACTHTPFDKIKANPEKVAEDHKTFGCDTLGIGSMPKEYRENNFAKIDEFVDFANNLSATLAKYDMNFAYHNHSFELENNVQGKKVLDYLADNTDKRVNFILDTYWVRFAGCSIDEYINKLSGRIKNVHFKDYKGKILFFKFPHWVELGKGEIDFPKYMGMLAQNGTENVLYEQDICRNPWKSTEISWDYMQKNLMK